MNLPKNILIATDFSAISDDAVATGLDIARALGARVHLLHVCEPLAPSDVPEFEAPAVDQQEREASRRLDAYLEQRSALPQVETLVEVGDAQERILRAIEHLAVDLVVLGTHGRRGPRRMLLGSVAEKIMRAAPCPVLVVRPRALQHAS